jgi:hypothetical protein
MPEITGAPSLEPSDPVQIIRDVCGLNCSAYSSTQDAGRMQIHLPGHQAKFLGRSPYDCRANAEVAKQIFDASGWGAWAAYNNGAWRRFL